uniref:Potassium calcium-activated channel subfamily U member 1 n=1 Tax=Varanus komodoensis TaxID=61221 RepID=A0A8D2LIK0_VARKO
MNDKCWFALSSVKQFCLSFEDQTVMIDLFFNAFFLLYFGLRFLAASDKLTFWLELNSVVDFFTITPVCVSFYLGRNWLALNTFDLTRSLFYEFHLHILIFVLNFILLLHVQMENSGDPWVQEKNSQNLTYFECLYLIMVTMSTVGYGDVVVKTSLGRAFILFFIVGGLILFANLVPEIVDIVGSTKLYKGSYIAVKGRKYIVVCGDINLNSVTAFLRDFLNHSTGEVATEIIFLGENPPSLELETIFRCYAAYISFFQGTVMKSDDLVRVQVRPFPTATIHYVLCRVLSIKNHYPHTRVIIQIIQSSNKVYLPKLPNWDWRKGDSIICFSELKLGLIAQSCVVPGLTTILTSLFIREGIQELISGWVSLGRALREFEITFCFAFLFDHSILINPTSMIQLHSNTMGFFIAKSTKELRRHNKKLLSSLRDHIVVCVFGDATSTLIGLRNFVMPLRASNFTFSELKYIVFLGSLEYLQREWEFIQNFPKLALLKGSALSCADLKAANIKYCAMCVIISAHARGTGDQTLVDTKSILATLNIRSLQFKLSPSSDKPSQDTMGNQSMPIFSKRIPIITELTSNAQFFEQRSGADDCEYFNQNVSQNFSRGTIFSDSFLDSLLCTVSTS